MKFNHSTIFSNCASVPPWQNFSSRILISFFIVLFFLTPKISFAIGDSIPGDTAKKMDLWDPNNPNCPCHQYQKLADEEYKRLQDQKRKDSLNAIGQYQNNDGDSTANTNSTTTSTTNKHSLHSKSKLKYVSKAIRKSKLFRVRKTSGKKWRKGHLIDCGRF